MISIQDVTFGYKKKAELLLNLDLELNKGKIYGLFGLNGSGKTTLLNNISGTLFPESGSCRLDGRETKYRQPNVMNRLFVVPEQFELPKITGKKYIELHSFFYPKFNYDLMDEILIEFEIDTSLKLPALSYGQRKKFLISFAIASQTELLLFDEPTNGLDIPSKSQFRKIVASLDLESRCILISTHQVRDLGYMIDHVLVLKDGNIVFNYDSDKIFNTISIQKIDEESDTNIIYGEEILGGIHAIVPATDKAEKNFDLELLFNGVIQKTEEMNQTFNGVEK
ncbi:MAG: ABC transporter ATP-binding protein [Balneola sp.]